MLVLLNIAAYSSRDVVPFDYAWRFKTVPSPRTACPPFNTSVASGGTCSGLSPTPAGDASAASCRLACCASDACSVYQYGLSTASCWTGNCTTPFVGNSSQWVSGASPQPQPGGCADCAVGLNDSAWELIDAPHDYIVATQPFDNKTSAGAGYFTRVDAVYRKHFALPAAWRGERVALRFEGVFKTASVFVNGVAVKVYGGSPGQGGVSAAAYTEFDVRLDNISGIAWGAGGRNLIALYVNGDQGMEHWYTGAGLYRSVHLIHTKLAHLDPLSLFFPATLTFDGAAAATSATVHPELDVVNDAAAEDAAGEEALLSVNVSVFIYDGDGALRGSARDFAAALPRGVTRTTVHLPSIVIKAPHVWSNRDPYLYTVVTTVATAAAGQLDAFNTTLGVRSIRWDYDRGFFLNDVNVKLRGFCHHDSFTGVGMAMPDRVWLLRAQQNRGVGANAWRMSHNNYRESVYDLADVMGTVVWDENRDLRDTMGLEAMSKMVRAHRNHPSVAIYSLCNEGECAMGAKDGKYFGNDTVYAEFRSIAKQLDPTRAVSGNAYGWFGNGTISDFFDVQGLSHPSTVELLASRAANLPTRRPLITSECCSCRTQRGEDSTNVSPMGLYPPNVTRPHYSAFNADCLLGQVNQSGDNDAWNAGSMIWTLGDYIGEPARIDWPHVSSSFGAVDLAGFPKAGARWFQAWWLFKNNGAAWFPASRPTLPTGEMVHIVESNVGGAERSARASDGERTFHVYSSGASVDLYLDGASLGTLANDAWMGWNEWNVTSAESAAATNLTAVARDAAGAVVATHSRLANVSPAQRIVLTIDAPSPTTGTGRRVVLDGHDVALLRATIVDSRGTPVHTATHNVTFEVLSGPGRVLGVGNGDPMCKEPHQASWRSAYSGLARAVIKVTEDAASSAATRALIRAIDVESGRSTVAVLDPALPLPDTPITVRASAPGLGSATIAIAVSADAALDGILATAKASLRVPISLE